MIEEFFFSDGIRATLISIPYKILESEEEQDAINDMAICLGCDKMLERKKENDYNFISHNLLECLRNILYKEEE